MSARLAQVLQDFEFPQTPAAAGFDISTQITTDPFLGDAASEASLDFADQPEIDTAALEAEARQAGLCEGRQQAEAEHSERLQELQATHQAEIDALKQLHEQEIETRLGQAIQVLHEQFASAVEPAVADALSPFLSELARDKAVAELSRTLAALGAESDGQTVTVCGSETLFDAIAQRLETSGLTLVHQAAESPDVVVSIDQQMLTTRLAAWQDAMKVFANE